MMLRPPLCDNNGCCESCTFATDDFADGSINASWTVVGDPVESGGVVTLDGDETPDGEYMIWDDDLKLEETGFSVEIKVRFTKDFDHPTLPNLYVENHHLDILYDWDGVQEFISVRFRIDTSGRTYIDVYDYFNDVTLHGPIRLYTGRNDEVTIKLCLFPNDNNHPYDNGYTLYATAAGQELWVDVPEPTTFLTGFGTKITTLPQYQGNLFEVSNWTLSRLNPSCPCSPSPGCIILEHDFTGSDTSDLSLEYTEVSGDWQRTSNRLNPPATGKLRLNSQGPSIRLFGAKWSSIFNFGGATGVANWLINWDTDDNYYFAEFECTAENSATLTLRHRNEGTDSDLAPSIPLGIDDFDWDSDHIIELCLTKNTITVTLNNSSSNYIVLDTVPLFGLYLGLEVISVGSNAYFDDIELSRLLPECDACLETFDCDVCVNDEAPRAMVVTLQGLYGAPSVLNGSYVVPIYGCGGTPFAGYTNDGGEACIGPGSDFFSCGYTNVAGESSNNDSHVYNFDAVQYRREFPYPSSYDDADNEIDYDYVICTVRQTISGTDYITVIRLDYMEVWVTHEQDTNEPKLLLILMFSQTVYQDGGSFTNYTSHFVNYLGDLPTTEPIHCMEISDIEMAFICHNYQYNCISGLNGFDLLEEDAYCFNDGEGGYSLFDIQPNVSAVL